MSAGPPPLRSLVCGAGGVPLADRQAAVPVLARAIAARARRRGFAPVKLKRSHNRGSCSCYLHLTLFAQLWIIRVSDHERPHSANPGDLHFELVARDGRSGFDHAVSWLDEIAISAHLWWDARPRQAQPRPPRPPRPRRIADEEAHNVL
ncbi:hypothetical protein B5C34_05355 [Pacificimonas flava]|uniref:Uncharacterized protein n=2 Tax=Pacificimonas TaxID=1960290 RepID=A0A219B571_9SPHN|nr:MULTISPECIES: hypothetical protein [Pacificimonas]MBZ6377353.1 hypothetical protein [Pacificimonas aurantium]OWV32939.1 hypothetical protein B5C34_05355 [Pacificimonas flava]